MSPTLPEQVRCPETGLRLALAREDAVARVESRRCEKALRFSSTPSGPLQIDLGTPITEGLLREDGLVFYVIQNGVPILLPGHGITMEAM